MYYYQHSPTCFGAYCAFFRENFFAHFQNYSYILRIREVGNFYRVTLKKNRFIMEIDMLNSFFFYLFIYLFISLLAAATTFFLVQVFWQYQFLALF